MEWTIDCRTVNSTLKSTPIQKLEISKPSTNLWAIQITIPLIIKRNNPKVSIVTGRVRMIKSGFTDKFSKASTSWFLGEELNEWVLVVAVRYVFFVNCKILFCASIWEGSCSTNSYLIEVGCMNLYHVVICLMDIDMLLSN